MASSVCYIGHGYHNKTQSTNFFVELLRSEFGSVDVYDDDTYLGVKFDSLEEIVEKNYELIVVFQSEVVAKELADRNGGGRVIFVPMYDGCRNLPEEYWRSFADKENVHVISFSSTLHYQLKQWGVKSSRYQYFPKVENKEIQFGGEKNAFFWCRTDNPSIETIRKLVGDNKLDRIHFHLANDPNHQVLEHEVRRLFSGFNVTTSTWFENASDYQELLNNTSIYFAPRSFEGIGMSFLEALGHGCCVVAPNNPTMNEYIVHGVNGFLYDENQACQIDLDEIDSICFQASKTAQNGRREWEKDSESRLISVIRELSVADSSSSQEYSLWHWDNECSKEERCSNDLVCSADCLHPMVTVAVVCRNVEDTIEKTLQSIFSQSYDNFEIVVIDGLSTDSTMGIVNRYMDAISVCVSEADKGPYDAMSKAARYGNGDYIIYMNAGDYFTDNMSLDTAMCNVFEDDSNKEDLPDFIIGNHIYLHENGISNLHITRRFEDTWNELLSGDLTPNWWGGIPCHQATLTKRSLLEEAGGYNESFDIAADHEFMFRNRSLGKKFVHCNHTMSVYVGGGLSAVEGEKCGAESWRIASTYGNVGKIKPYFIKNFGLNSIYSCAPHVYDEIKDIRDSGMFWEDWYRLQYLPKELTEIDPIMHYLLEGRAVGAMPNPCFCPNHYYEANSDVPRDKFDPLLHYVRNGVYEKRPTLNWSKRDENGAFLCKIFNPFEKNLTELDKELLDYSHEQLISCIHDE